MPSSFSRRDAGDGPQQVLVDVKPKLGDARRFARLNLAVRGGAVKRLAVDAPDLGVVDGVERHPRPKPVVGCAGLQEDAAKPERDRKRAPACAHQEDGAGAAPLHAGEVIDGAIEE